VSKDEILARVRDIMAETFELDRERIVPGARLYEDLELDSIDALDMVVKLQELIARRVDEQELRALRTVADVVDMVASALSRVDRTGPASGQTSAEKLGQKSG
jgi:acyl carrier protein